MSFIPCCDVTIIAPLIASEGIIMSLIKMDKILDIDPENMTVRCQSGVRIHDLCEALVPYNLAVGTLGTIDWQTISGAVMTGKEYNRAYVLL